MGLELEPTTGGATWCSDHIFLSLGREAQASPPSVSRTMEDAGTRSFVERIREMGLQPRSLPEAWGELPKRPGTAESVLLSGMPRFNQPLTSRFPHLQSCVLSAGSVDSINLEFVIALTGHGLHLLFELRA